MSCGLLPHLGLVKITMLRWERDLLGKRLLWERYARIEIMLGKKLHREIKGVEILLSCPAELPVLHAFFYACGSGVNQHWPDALQQ